MKNLLTTKLYRKYFLLFTFLLGMIFFEDIRNFYKELVFSENIFVALITIIAGLFGFLIALIPLSMQLLEIKENKTIDRINNNDLNIKSGVFNDYINVIKSSFYLFLYLLLIEFIRLLKLDNYLFLILSPIYIILILNFIEKILSLMKVLKKLIDIYIGDQI